VREPQCRSSASRTQLSFLLKESRNDNKVESVCLCQILPVFNSVRQCQMAIGGLGPPQGCVPRTTLHNAHVSHSLKCDLWTNEFHPCGLINGPVVRLDLIVRMSTFSYFLHFRKTATISRPVHSYSVPLCIGQGRKVYYSRIFQPLRRRGYVVNRRSDFTFVRWSTGPKIPRARPSTERQTISHCTSDMVANASCNVSRPMLDRVVDAIVDQTECASHVYVPVGKLEPQRRLR
jgi:hypothetical protein